MSKVDLQALFDAQDVHGLIAVISYPDAAPYLEHLGTVAVEPLIEFLIEDNSHNRRTAATILGNIGDKRAVEVLIDALRDSDQWLRDSAARALGTMDGATVISRLGKCLNDEQYQEYGARRAVIEALGHTRDERAVEHLVSMLDDKDHRLAGFAATSLGNIGGDAAVGHLLSVLQIDHQYARRKVVVALGGTGDSRVIVALANILNHDEDWSVRSAAAEALGNFKNQQAVDFLTGALSNDDYRILSSIVKGLELSGGDTACQALEGALKHPVWQARRDSAAALGSFGTQSLPALVDALNDPHAEVRKSATESVAKIGGQEAVSLLGGILDSESDWERALEPLGKIGEPAVDTLITALQSENRWVRKGAAEALGKLGDSRAIEPLKPLLGDEHWQIRRAAVLALSSLGEDFEDPQDETPATPQLRLSYYHFDPWGAVIGADSASFVHYDDGLTIYEHARSPTGYFSVKLDETERGQFWKRLRIEDFSRLQNYYNLAPDITDVPVDTFTLSDGETQKKIGVEGGGFGRVSIEELDDDIPEPVINVYKIISSFRHRRERPWLPEKIEVMIWLWEYAEEQGNEWLDTWPDLYDLDTVQRGPGSYSIFVEAKYFKTIKQLAKKESPLLLAGRKWAMSYRFPIPGESLLD